MSSSESEGDRHVALPIQYIGTASTFVRSLISLFTF